METEVFLFEEDLHEELVEAAVDVPIDAAEVIATDVGAVIGELDRLATFLAATFAEEFAGEGAAAGDIEAFDLGDEPRIEEILDGLGASWRSGFQHVVGFLLRLGEFGCGCESG